MSRTLSATGPAIPTFLDEPALVAVRLEGNEGVNGLFEYVLTLKTPDALNLGASEAADFDLDEAIGREISCAIALDGMGEFAAGRVGPVADHIGAGTREINAIVTEAVMAGEEGRHIVYRYTLRPWLHLATLNVDCKVYQNQSPIVTLDQVLANYSFPVVKRLYDSYQTRDYCVQYNESDFEFFERLCQECGINYFFEHSEGAHRLVLTDAMAGFRPCPSAAYREVEFHAPGYKTDAEYVHHFAPHHRLTSGAYATTDYDYNRPRASLSSKVADPRPTGHAGLEVYNYHADFGGAHFVQPDAGSTGPNDPGAEGRAVARLRMQRLRTHGVRSHGSGNLRGMVPGHTCVLVGHPQRKANVEWLILAARFLVEDVAQDSQVRGAAAGRSQQWKVTVDFEFHPSREELRPALTRAKPKTGGPQNALVVGPAGQNIWTDRYGRIKVQFSVGP